MRKTIFIPHLAFTVRIRPVPKDHTAYASTYEYRSAKTKQLLRKAEIMLPRGAGPGPVAHEVSHVIQTICDCFNIDPIKESEHIGYLTQFLVEEILEGRKAVR